MKERRKQSSKSESRSELELESSETERTTASDVENDETGGDHQDGVVEINANHMRMMTNMLRSVIYVACSRVIDDKSATSPIIAAVDYKSSHRSIERIELLIKLIEHKPEFVCALVQHIARLQLEREEMLQVPSQSKNWLFNEVSKSFSIFIFGFSIEPSF